MESLDEAREHKRQADAVRQNELLTKERQSEQELALLADSVSVTEAANITGASEQHLRRLIKSKKALSFTSEGYLMLPSWQLQKDAFNPVVPRVNELAQAFPGDLKALHTWLHDPRVDMIGILTPLEALRSGDEVFSEEVINLAGSIGAAGR